MYKVSLMTALAVTMLPVLALVGVITGVVEHKWPLVAAESIAFIPLCIVAAVIWCGWSEDRKYKK